MADLWLGLAAQRQKIPMVVISRPARWVSFQEVPFRESIYGRFNKHCPEHTAMYHSWEEWKTIPLPSV